MSCPLTLAIQQLEQEIGVSLFNRHAKEQAFGNTSLTASSTCPAKIS